MHSRSIPAQRFSALELVRTALTRLTSFSRGRLKLRRARSLRICETLSLGNRGYLAVVSYRRQEFLVGGTNNSIALLAQLPDSAAAEPENAEEGGPAR